VKFGTFFDGKMTKQEVLCLASFQQMGHAVTVFSYHEIDLPRGVARADARAIFRSGIFSKSKRVHIADRRRRSRICFAIR